MNLEYMQQIQLFLDENNYNGNKIELIKIEALEQKIGKTFPKAYKEFLELAGKGFRPLSATGLSGNLDSLEEFNEMAKANLKEYGLGYLIEKDFWVVAEMDGSLYIHYIFFNEGDNPPVYGLDIENYEEDPKEFFRKSANSFSEYVETFINNYDPNLDN
jgi:hypothetical protein